MSREAESLTLRWTASGRELALGTLFKPTLSSGQKKLFHRILVAAREPIPPSPCIAFEFGEHDSSCQQTQVNNFLCQG